MTEFDIEFLDHVAIMVADIDESVKWYKNVLGLKKYQVSKWGAFPIFMLAGKTGIAIFPADNEGSDSNAKPHSIRIDHFAFNVSQDNFELAKKRYDELELSYRFKDHHYFHSLYTQDPDGHTVELTTLVVPETDFY